jgi:oxygen-independent coproporphyrinogen III oxidase
MWRLAARGYIRENFPVQRNSALVLKLSQPVPRYTSYPTVPFWKKDLDISRWKSAVRERFAECNGTEGISLYVHLPFCESLCIYCGCNKKISRTHTVEDAYVEAVLKEWGMYLELMGRPAIQTTYT